MRSTAYQIEHEALREVLRGFLVAKVESSRGTGEGGRVEFGAVAALDSLLAAHPVNRRGQCRSCQRPGWLGRRRVCLVYVKAHYWLRQPAHRMQAHVADELGVDPPTSPCVANPDVTRVLPHTAEEYASPLPRRPYDSAGSFANSHHPRSEGTLPVTERSTHVFCWWRQAKIRLQLA